MANNPHDPQLVQIKKTLDRAGIARSNRGFGSIATAPARTRQAPPAEPAALWPENLAELDDVDITTDPPTINQILLWNGTDWVPGDAPTPPGAPNDKRWKVGSGEVTIDEFADGSIDGAWVRAKASGIPALPSLANPTYVEDADVLSVKYGPATGSGAGTADGATARHTGFVRPLSSIGGSLAVGDGIITAFTPILRATTNHRMSGLVFSTTNADNAGNQLYYRWWTNGNLGMRTMVAWAGDPGNLSGDYNYGAYLCALQYQRIVRISSTTWRGDVSPDGVSWILGNSLVTWAFEPTHVGFAESNWNTTTPSSTSYEFIRRVSGVA